MKKDKDDAKRIKNTPIFRVAYPYLFTPSVMKGTKNEPKYSVTMLFSKDTDLKPITRAIRAAKVEKFGEDKDKWPKGIRSPIEDGDDEKFSDREGFANAWAVKASSSQNIKPGVFDQKVKPITDPGVLYPGCYAIAAIFARIWEFPEDSGKYGVQFILDHVQKIKDGDSFSGRKSGEDVFSPVDSSDDNDEQAIDEDEDDKY